MSPDPKQWLPNAARIAPDVMKISQCQWYVLACDFQHGETDHVLHTADIMLYTLILAQVGSQCRRRRLLGSHPVLLAYPGGFRRSRHSRMRATIETAAALSLRGRCPLCIQLVAPVGPSMLNFNPEIRVCNTASRNAGLIRIVDDPNVLLSKIINNDYRAQLARALAGIAVLEELLTQDLLPFNDSADPTATPDWAKPLVVRPVPCEPMHELLGQLYVWVEVKLNRGRLRTRGM